MGAQGGRDLRRRSWKAIVLVPLVGCAAALPLIVGKAGTTAVGAIYPLPRVGLGAERLAAPSYTDSGPPLLFVDQERVPGPGLLARAQVSGAVRLFGYEVPQAPAPLSFVWVLYNAGTRPVAVTVTDHAAAAPSRRYLPLAASVQRAFLAGAAPESFQIGAGSLHVLRDASAAPAVRGQLAFSIYDLTLSGRLRVLAIASSDPAGLTPGTLPATYPGGGGISALFPHDARTETVQFTRTRTALAIGAHDAVDPGMVAPDTLTGGTERDGGNYGVTYNVRILFPPSPAASTHLWVTAGTCALRADALVRSGALRGRVVQIPAVGALPTGDTASALATVQLSMSHPSAFSFSMLPPAASCAPIRVQETPANPGSLPVRLYQRPAWRWLARALWGA